MPPSSEILNLVRDDVLAGLAGFFDPVGDGFGIDPKFEGGVGDDHRAAVGWRYQGRHVRDFQGIARTGLVVTVVGATMIDATGPEPRVTRYVDWLGMLSQLGASVSTRVGMDEAQYAYSRKRDS